MPPSPQPLTIISEDDLKKKSHKTAFMEALLQKTMDATPDNNNDDTFNNNNLTQDNNNSMDNAPSPSNNASTKSTKSSAKAYANALNALTGPGVFTMKLQYGGKG